MNFLLGILSLIVAARGWEESTERKDPSYGSIDLISRNGVMVFQFLLDGALGGDYICSSPFEPTTTIDVHDQFIGFNIK